MFRCDHFSGTALGPLSVHPSLIYPQVGLAIFLESPLRNSVQKLFEQLKKPQAKAMAGSGNIAQVAFKARNAAHVLKVRAQTKKGLQLTFTDHVENLPHQDSEVGPGVQPEEAATALPADDMPRLVREKQEGQRKPPSGLPPTLEYV